MNKTKRYKFLIFLILFAFLLFPFRMCNGDCVSALTELKISSRAGLLVDYDSGKVIFEKNADERLPIASMTKIASLSIVLNYLEKGVVKESDVVLVSENAASIGGSSAFLDAGSSYKLSDLIKTVIIASANDSTVALAEFVAGSEELFVEKMNKLCNDLSLKDTHFKNSTGLPCDDHYSTANDLVKIYKTICNNPLYKEYSKIWMTDFIHPTGRKTGLVNTNRLIKTYDGIDGGKTGYTDKARFCLTASAQRGQTRLVGVIIGANDSKTRFSEMSMLFNYGFSNYETKLYVNIEAPVSLRSFKNARNAISIYPEKNISKLTLKTEKEEYSVDYQINDLKAPIKKNDIVGKMFLFDKDNMVVEDVNLIAGEDCKAVGFRERFNKLLKLW